MSMKGMFLVSYSLMFSSVISYSYYVIHSHITEQATRRRYGRSPKNIRAFAYKFNRLGHNGNAILIDTT